MLAAVARNHHARGRNCFIALGPGCDWRIREHPECRLTDVTHTRARMNNRYLRANTPSTIFCGEIVLVTGTQVLESQKGNGNSEVLTRQVHLGSGQDVSVFSD